jgi:hypothetical protein
MHWKLEKTCGECTWFKAGECRRYPPVWRESTPNPHYRQHHVQSVDHPYVGTDYPACGEWSAE